MELGAVEMPGVVAKLQEMGAYILNRTINSATHR
jgi:hypothetical protein